MSSCALLAVCFAFVGLQELCAAEAATSGKVVFEYCHSNAAWGHRLNGFFIDNEGDVWKYDHSAERWQPSRSDGILYEFDLKEKYRDAKKIGTIDKAVLSAMIYLIDSASQGELKQRPAGNDMGALSYIAYLYDPGADTYKEVILSSKGDQIVDNTASAAKTLTQWLESVFVQQPARSDQGENQQTLPRGKIRAVNPELSVIQKIPAPKPEIRVEQRGPFPVEDRKKQNQ
jgi:hypothetical protein